jgi:hypothetical protein
MSLASSVSLAQHPDEHRPEHPVLLAVDQELGEGAALRIAPELTDPLGPLEVGEHQDANSSARRAGPRLSRPSRIRRSTSSGRIDPEATPSGLSPPARPGESIYAGAMVRLAREGSTWRIGTDAEVAWIANSTSTGLTITSAIPPVFEAYATVVLPYGGEAGKA